MIIDRRFNGPPGSGNGGYSAGLLAARYADQPADPGHADAIEVTLRRPPPLDTPLRTRRDGEVLSAYAGEDLVMQARPGTIDHPVVPAVTPDEARAVSASYPGFTAHPFPTCYVCGPARAEGDGLRLFPGRRPDGRTAALFTAPAGCSPLLLWAALDCPGGWAVPQEEQPHVLGRITARVHALPPPGAPCVVTGALLDRAGRKARVHTAVYDPDGALLACAEAVWLAVPPGA
jgi:hypothetical protein